MKVLRTIFQCLTSRRRPPARERGQSLVELALTLPILLLIMAGTLEIGMYYNEYLSLVDATRESARYLADQKYDQVDNTVNQKNCNVKLPPTTNDFFAIGGCDVYNNLFGVEFDPTTDDIIVSAVTIAKVSGQITITARYPLSTDPVPMHSTGGNPENGWSYCRNILDGAGCTPAASYFNNANLVDRLTSYVHDAPATGLVIVEIYHLHHQFLGLIPPGLAFLPQDVMIHAYTIMPLPSASPPAS